MKNSTQLSYTATPYQMWLFPLWFRLYTWLKIITQEKNFLNSKNLNTCGQMWAVTQMLQNMGAGVAKSTCIHINVSHHDHFP